MLEESNKIIAMKAVIFAIAFTLITTGLLLIISAITCYLTQDKL